MFKANSLLRSVTSFSNQQMLYTPSRNIFFGKRLLNKPMKRQSNEWTNTIDDETYVKAMKKFQKDTRGILPTSVEYK